MGAAPPRHDTETAVLAPVTCARSNRLPRSRSKPFDLLGGTSSECAEGRLPWGHRW